MITKNFCIVCKSEGLQQKTASFGLLKDGKKIHCSKHKLSGEIDLCSRYWCVVCKEKNIYRRAGFGLEKDCRRIHCSLHKVSGEINLSIGNWCIICLEIGERVYASYGENKRKIHCKIHKTKDDKYLVNKNGCIVCIELNLIPIKTASFGLASDRKKIHCSKHKISGEVDLNARNWCVICLQNNILTNSTYGLTSDNKKIHCFKHKLDNDINLLNFKRSCITCKKLGIPPFITATYGTKKDNKKLHCFKHKLDGELDLTHKRWCVVCLSQNIYKHSSYGLYFEKIIHCSVHKLANEYRNNNPKCTEKGCKEKPLYTSEKTGGNTPERCEKHKNDTDIDIISRKCDICGDEYFIPSIMTTCHNCIGFSKKKQNRGVKEKAVSEILVNMSDDIGMFTSNITIKDGCSNKRPDFYYEDFNPYFSLIVECDENQHSKYSCGITGEIKRMINLFEEGNNGHPIIFIRFNPDSYYIKNKITNIDIKERYSVLRKTILGLKNREIFDYKIGVVYLYYDNFETIEIKELVYRTKGNNVIVEHNHPHQETIQYMFSIN